MEESDVVKLAQNRRDQTRRGFFRSVNLSLRDQQLIEARAFDISNDGMGVTIDVSLAKSTSCTLTFKLPLDAGATFAVEVRAVVVYAMLSGKMGGFMTGLQFVDPSTQVADAIRRYVAA